MQSKEIEELLDRYNSGMATPKEKALVETWYLKYKPAVLNVSRQQLEEDQHESLNKLLFQINSKNKKAPWPALVAAASLLIFLTAGLYFLIIHKPQQQQVAINKPLKNDIAPGGNKAILTLSNGQ